MPQAEYQARVIATASTAAAGRSSFPLQLIVVGLRGSQEGLERTLTELSSASLLIQEAGATLAQPGRKKAQNGLSDPGPKSLLFLFLHLVWNKQELEPS